MTRVLPATSLLQQAQVEVLRMWMPPQLEVSGQLAAAPPKRR